MTTPLFRSTAVRHVTNRLNGKVVLFAPISSWWLGGLLVFVLVAALIYAVTASYAKKQTVVGWIIPETGLVRPTANNGGVVLDIMVQTGAMVRVGDVLASLRLSSQSKSGNTGEILSQALRSQLVASENKAKSQINRLNAEEIRLQRQKKALEAELAEVGKQIDIQAQRVALNLGAFHNAKKMMEQGHLSKAGLDASNATLLDDRQSLANLKRSHASLSGQISNVKSQIVMLPFERASAEAVSATASLEIQSVQSNIASQYYIISPVNGRVDALFIRQGESLLPNTAIVAITPEDNEMIVELYVPSRAAGFIKPGQDINIKYQAFPYQKFGMGKGKIKTVSLTILAPNEVRLPGVQFQEPVFRIIASLEKMNVDVYGETIPLRSGMLVDAEIVIDERNLAQWLLDPLYAAGYKS